MRKLALDIGAKSCGIAISDEMNVIAQGLENFFFPNQDWEVLLAKIILLFEKYPIDTIVIGYPTFPSGDKTATGQMIDEFVKLLKTKITTRIVFINENHTTKKAQAIMRKSGLNARRQKEYKDQLAAQLILEDYLMSQ